MSLSFASIAGSMINITSLQTVAVSTGGGGGIPGAPTIITGSGTSGKTISSLSQILNPSGNNTIMLWFVDWYHATNTANTPTWQGSSTGVNLWSNFKWYNDNHGQGSVYYLLNPVAGSGTSSVSFTGAVDETTMFTCWGTNCSNTGSYNTFFIASTSGPVYVTASSATNYLQLFYSIVSAVQSPSAIGNGQVYISNQTPGGTTHESIVTQKSGSINSDTSSVTWTDANNAGAFNGGIVGF